VFSYGLSGAVCFTNAAGYLHTLGDTQSGLCFYSMRRLADMAEQVATLLARPAALAEAGQRARDNVLSSHTWRQRVPTLLATLAAGASAAPR
jgi:spore maturation protein CgeB